MAPEMPLGTPYWTPIGRKISNALRKRAAVARITDAGISQEIPACLQEGSRQISPWRYLGDRGDDVTTTR
jgi:hypothetical protein